MRPSRFETRSVSMSMSELSMGSRRMVRSVTTPVSPSAPAVAQKMSDSVSGVATTVSFGARKVRDRTWFAKLPSTWWFLP